MKKSKKEKIKVKINYEEDMLEGVDIGEEEMAKRMVATAPKAKKLHDLIIGGIGTDEDEGILNQKEINYIQIPFCKEFRKRRSKLQDISVNRLKEVVKDILESPGGMIDLDRVIEILKQAE